MGKLLWFGTAVALASAACGDSSATGAAGAMGGSDSSGLGGSGASSSGGSPNGTGASSNDGGATSSGIALDGGGGEGAGTPDPFVCDPAAEPGSLYELAAESLDINELTDVSMCRYRGDVLLIVNTAAA